MKLVTKVSGQFAALVALLLTMPAAYGAGHGPADTALEAEVRIGQLQQGDGQGNWSTGANFTHSENSDVPFRLGMDARSTGTYVLEIEYTHLITRNDQAAVGFTGLDDFDIDGSDQVTVGSPEGPTSGSTTPQETTKYYSVPLEIDAEGQFFLLWDAALGGPGDGLLGPSAIEGALVHVTLRGVPGNKTVPINTNSIVAVNDPGETCSGFCDNVPPCEQDCDGVPPCVEDCDGVPPVDPLEPGCTGEIVVATVDADGADVGPSSALLDSTSLSLDQGRGRSATTCGEVVVALTSIPPGFQVAGAPAVHTHLQAASTHLATQAVEVGSETVTEVTFVLSAASQPTDPIVPEEDGDDDESDPVVEVEDEVEIEDGTDEETTDGDSDTGSDRGSDNETDRDPPTAGGTDPSRALPAPAPGDGGGDSADLPGVDRLPRTGADTPALLLLALVLLAGGTVALRASART